MTRDAASDLPTRPSPAPDVTDFDAVDSHEALLAWSRAYSRRAVAATDLAVDLPLVDWEVSTRAKRRAAAVLHPRLEDTALGDPVDWAARLDTGARGPGDSSAAQAPDEPATDSNENWPDGAARLPGGDSRDCGGSTPGRPAPGASDGGASDGGASDGGASASPPRCTVRLTWGAAKAYDRETWAETLRHELVHVEQFQRTGTTGHGNRFERRAQDLATSVRCERFATPKYVLACPDCETVVARRYRDCKLVRRHEEYRSSCCERPLALTRTGATE